MEIRKAKREKRKAKSEEERDNAEAQRREEKRRSENGFWLCLVENYLSHLWRLKILGIVSPVLTHWANFCRASGASEWGIKPASRLKCAG
jgi:hypothetical protein